MIHKACVICFAKSCVCFLVTIVIATDNALTGSLSLVFNASSQHALANIDVSRNNLSGAIPASIFKLPSLSSFAAVSNCIDLGDDGLSSLNACAAKNLQALILVR